MKTIVSYSVFLLVVASVLGACRKDDVQPLPDLEVSAATTNKGYNR